MLQKCKRFLAASIVLLMMLPGLCSCSSRSESKSNSIKVYMTRYDSFYKRVLVRYKLKHQDVNVEETVFDDMEKYKQKLSSEIMAGEGPDIIYFNSNYLDNMFKLEKSGAFCDLQPYIKQDKDFNMADYNRKVMDCGMYNNKLLYIPVNYYIPVFFSTSETLQRNNISFDKTNFSQKQFFDWIEPYISSIQSKSGKYVFSGNIYLSEFIESSGLDFIDYQNKKVYFDKPEFKEIIDNYKKVYKYFADSDVKGKYLNQEYDMIKNGSALLVYDNSTISPEYFADSISYMKSLVNETEVIYPMPTYSGDSKYTAIADDCVAINSNSKNKKQALELIKTALSESMQSDTSLRYLPVNNKALTSVINKNKNKGSEKATYNGIDVTMDPVPEKIGKDYEEIINNAARCKFIESRVIYLILNPLYKYMEDKESYQSAVKEMKDKVLLYLNE